MHTVTLKQIIDYNPCLTGMTTLLEGLNIKIPPCVEEKYYDIGYGEKGYLFINSLTEEELAKLITLKFILENNGIKDALWCLQMFYSTKDYQNLKTDMLELIKLNYKNIYTSPNFNKCYSCYSISNMYAKMCDLIIEEGYDDETFKKQVTELFLKHFCQED
jgi:hypothetical protein